ncbi:MAG: glycosyltransferase family 2 protein [Anaerolineae bacterium]|nr:glycosyltransferase family 2 protein [Anaerolineae bacterium]
MSATLSVVIPAYNEEDGISIILDRILKVKPELKLLGVSTEVIVVDDGSKDKTAEIVRDFERKDSAVRLLQHKINKNYGGALKTGFKNANGDLLAFLDADGTYPPEYFPKMCQEMMKAPTWSLPLAWPGIRTKARWCARWAIFCSRVWSVLLATAA